MVGYLGVVVLAIVVIVQATVIPEIRIAGGMPDLLLLPVLAVTLLSGLNFGLVWAIIGGLLQDLISAVPLGTTSLGLVCAVVAVHLIFDQQGPRSLLIPSVAAVAGTLILHGVTLLVLALTGRSQMPGQFLVYVTLPSMIYNAVVMLPVYRLSGLFYRSERSRRVKGL